MTAREALESLPGWQPQPWPVDRAAAREALAQTPGLEQASSVWLSDGIARARRARPTPSSSPRRLRQLGPAAGPRRRRTRDRPLALRARRARPPPP